MYVLAFVRVACKDVVCKVYQYAPPVGYMNEGVYHPFLDASRPPPRRPARRCDYKGTAADEIEHAALCTPIATRVDSWRIRRVDRDGGCTSLVVVIFDPGSVP